MAIKTECATKIIYFFAVPLVAVVIITVFILAFKSEGTRWGNTGDALGGIVGTIISFVSVLLIFYAYISQLKANHALDTANKILLAQEEAKFITDQLKTLANIDLEERLTELREHLPVMFDFSNPSHIALTKVMYVVEELLFTLDTIEHHTGATKDLLAKKFRLLYESRYSLSLSLIISEKEHSKTKFAAWHEMMFMQLIGNIKGLNKRINDISSKNNE